MRATRFLWQDVSTLALEIQMQIVGELALTYTKYREIALAPAGGKIWVYRSLGLLLLLCEGLLATRGPLENAGYFAVAAALLLLFGSELLVLFGWSQHRALAAERPFRYELTAATVRINTAQTDVSVNWSGISQMRWRRNAWLFRVAGTGRSLVVPRAAFSAEAQNEIDAFVRERGGR
jgi:hypothetical protein